MAWAKVGTVGENIYGTYDINGFSIRGYSGADESGTPFYFNTVTGFNTLSITPASAQNDSFMLLDAGKNTNNSSKIIGIVNETSSPVGVTIGSINISFGGSYRFQNSLGSRYVSAKIIEGLVATSAETASIDAFYSAQYPYFLLTAYYFDNESGLWVEKESQVSNATTLSSELTSGSGSCYCFLFSNQRIVYAALDLTFNFDENIKPQKCSPILLRLSRCSSSGLEGSNGPFIGQVSVSDPFLALLRRGYS